jgi:positive regulator of sigma E activity
MQVMQPMAQQPTQAQPQQNQTQPVQQPSQPQAQPQQQGVVQRVSGYGEKTGIFSNTLVYILVFLLLFFGGVLLAVFLFRNELANLFNNLL